MLMTGKHKRYGPRLTVSLTDSDYDALSTIAEKDEVSLSWVVRRAINEYLDNHRPEVKPPLPLRALQKSERRSEGAQRRNT